MPATMTIELRNLRFFAQHGWHEEEAVLQNEFDVSVLVMFRAKETILDISDTVDYSKIYELVRKHFLQREKLLETVAQKIAAAIEAIYSEIQSLQITIIKLNAPIAAFTGTVGITYTKEY